MNCVFARRRFLNNKITIADLFSTATISICRGCNDRYGASSSIPISNIPTNGTVYVLSICNGDLGIWKFVNRTINQTPIFKSASNAGGIYYNTSYAQYNYYDGGYGTGTGNGTTKYGSALAVLTFSSDYTTDVIETLLSSMVRTKLSQRNSSSTGTVSTSNKAQTVYLCSKASDLDFWTPNGTTYTKIKGTSTAAASTSGSDLTLGSVYGGSIIGLT